MKKITVIADSGKRAKEPSSNIRNEAWKLYDNKGYAYKYRAFDRNALSILLDKELYFSSPNQLNDPYDCQIDVSGALINAIENCELMSIPPFFRQTLLDLQLQLKSRSETIEKLLNELNEYAVCSFTIHRNHPLMWSHYADAHRGMCLGFNLFKIIESQGDMPSVDNQFLCRAVEYTSDNPILPFLQMLAQTSVSSSSDQYPIGNFLYDLTDTVASTKSEAWSYEQEFRLIRKKSGTVKFIPEALTEVILGSRMTSRDRQTVLNILYQPEWNHVMLYEIKMNKSKFGFGVCPLVIHDCQETSPDRLKQSDGRDAQTAARPTAARCRNKQKS